MGDQRRTEEIGVEKAKDRVEISALPMQAIKA